MFAALKLETTGFMDPHGIVPQEVFFNPVAVRILCRGPVVLRTQLTLHAMFERKCNRLYVSSVIPPIALTVNMSLSIHSLVPRPHPVFQCCTRGPRAPGRSGDVIGHCFGRGLESPPTRPRNETHGTARLANYTLLGLALASTPGSIQRSLWPRLG